MTTHVWLRAEQKTDEKRMALVPSVACEMLASGMQITVERSTQGCFATAEFERVGCRIVDADTWWEAPDDAIILGLKELADDSFPLKHRHIHFAHVYKNQRGWKTFLRRFSAGGGVLYDLEYLLDERQRRVAAFGYWAGYAGAALALLAWCGQLHGAQPVLAPVSAYADRAALLAVVRDAMKSAGETPDVLVMGALGRSGQGVVELAREAGANVIAWDVEQTYSGGPFAEITQADVFINCVFIQNAIPPFVTHESLAQRGRRLTLICDVSCDPYGAYNPLPIYNEVTTFDRPVRRLIDSSPPLDLISIDHLPSMLPRESTEDFVDQLRPHLLGLHNMDSGVWSRAATVFHEKRIASDAD